MLIREFKLIFKFYIKSNLVMTGIIASLAVCFITLGDHLIERNLPIIEKSLPTMSDYNFATIFKLFAYAILIYFTNIFQYKSFYYYRNLGLSRKKLFIGSCCIDFLVYIPILLIINSIL